MYPESMEILYLEHFGLSERPFGLTPDPEFYFESQTHKDALDHLRFFLDQREGLAVIYGDVGLGKTTISRIFLSSLEKEKYNSALILNPIMDELGFLREILRELRIPGEDGSKKDLFDALSEFLIREHRVGRETVLAVDEAQLLSPELLELIRILSNIETEKEKLLHIVLFAQPELVETLKAPNLRYLSQRITVYYRLKPFSLEEIKRYISYRLIKAGSKGLPRFDDSALKLIHQASRGCPRLVNILCNRCLLTLYTESKDTADRDVIKRVLEEENISVAAAETTPTLTEMGFHKTSFIQSRLVLAGVCVLFLVVGGFTGFYFAGTSREVPNPVTVKSEPVEQREQPKVIVAANPVKVTGPVQPTVQKGKGADFETAGKPGAAPAPSTTTGNKDQKPSREVTVDKDAANVRQGPSLAEPRVAVIFRGEKLQVTGEQVDRTGLRWHKVLLYAGRAGWIADSVVKANSR
jgi:general secretion pathway protein A